MASKVHLLTVCYGCDAAVGEMAGDRRDSVVGVQEGCVFRCSEIQILLRGGQREIQRGPNLLLSAIADRWERGIWKITGSFGIHFNIVKVKVL